MICHHHKSQNHNNFYHLKFFGPFPYALLQNSESFLGFIFFLAEANIEIIDKHKLATVNAALHSN